jgi:Ni/Co efflux regulator RcnB
MTFWKLSAMASAALISAGLLFSAPVTQAQPYYRDYRPMDRGYRHGPPPRYMYGPYRHERRMAPRYMYGPPPRATVGRALPYDYRTYGYRINNWGYYRLPAPRRGHHWVQYGGQFLLVNTAGVVLQIFAR